MKILMLIVMFFCIGAFFIISQNNIHLDKSEGIDTFIFLYKFWLSNTLENVGSLAGHVVKLEWLPK